MTGIPSPASSHESSLLIGRGLTREYRQPNDRLFARATRTLALDAADVEVARGGATGIIGESGSGKSTLVRLLLGLDVPTAGTVSFDGRAVDARASARSLHWLRRATGIVLQDPYASLDPRMSIGRIISEPLWALRFPGNHRGLVRDALVRVGLDPDMAERYPRAFSGGQRQRIALARAIVHGPQLLVGDEPLSALDVSVRAQIIELLRELRHDTGMALLLVSHDIGVVQALCDEVIVMKDGVVVESGATKRVLFEPTDAYTRELLAAVPTLPAE